MSTITVAAVQTHPIFGDLTGNRDRAAQLVRANDAHLYVLPELFDTGYLFADRDELSSLSEPFSGGSTVEFLCALSKETNSVIVAGFAEADGEKLYNSAAICDHGRRLACYRKIHLFNTEKKIFDPGDTPPPVIETSVGRLGPMVCFDWIFPETMRCLALGGAQIIAHCANLVLPYCQEAMVTRTLENRVFAVTANRIGTDDRAGDCFTFTGGSQITAFDGKKLACADGTTEMVITSEITPTLADEKSLNPFNHLMNDRKPHLYTALTNRPI
jgi:predicted amidohydrolase